MFSFTDANTPYNEVKKLISEFHNRNAYSSSFTKLFIDSIIAFSSIKDKESSSISKCFSNSLEFEDSFIPVKTFLILLIIILKLLCSFSDNKIFSNIVSNEFVIDRNESDSNNDSDKLIFLKKENIFLLKIF